MTYIIDFKKDTTKEQIDTYFQQNNLSVLQVYNHFELVYLVDGPAVPVPADIIESIINDNDQNIVPLSYSYAVPEDTSKDIVFDIQDEKNWWKTYSLMKVNLEEPQKEIKRKGKNTKVYILDSGINDSHPEFVNTQINKLFTITDNFTDTSGHGTAIASIIAGETCGLTDATLQIVKIFDTNVTTKLSQMLAALDSIANDYYTNPKYGSVINISWSIPKNLYVEQKLEQLINMGLMVVCSAGNNGTTIEDVTPACMESVLTIGAYNQDFYPCDFSNYTSSAISVTDNSVNWGSLDGWAPGVQIYIADLNQGYTFGAGTSLSAAIASGALVYNISKMYSDENQNPLFHIVDHVVFPRDYLAAHTVFRNGLLTLEGNYSHSVNKVISYHASTYDTNSKMSMQGLMHFRKGVENKTLLFVFDDLKNIECANDLLPGLSFSMGWLIGDPNIDLEGQEYKFFDYEFLITLKNEETLLYNLKLAVTENSVQDLSAIPDQNLQITLQQLPGCNDVECVNRCSILSPYCIVCGPPKFNDCFCTSYAYTSCP